VGEILGGSSGWLSRDDEVVVVVHVMRDVLEGGERPHNGHHNLKVVVKKINSKHLGS
jgi:hypothetical protein